MSEPRTHTNPLEGARSELISGLSALHMEPQPLPENEQGDDGYLTDLDYWAQHAQKHFYMAYEELSRVSEAVHRLQHQIFAMLKVYRNEELAAKLTALLGEINSLVYS